MRPRLLLILSALALAACPDPVDGDGDGVPVDEDCDDSDPDVSPEADEVCNGVDDDCDGTVDNGLEFRDFHPDVDLDTYGDVDADPLSSCEEAVDGMVADGTDCDDEDAAVHPGAVELCNDVDDDCNGLVDDEVEFQDWYPDLDGDTYGDADAQPVNACAPPTDDHVVDHTDCDDTNADIHPGADEIPGDGIDQDCTDLDAGTCFEDLDEDGHGTEVVVVSPTGDCSEPGYSLLDDDCDDTDASIFPGATDVVGDGIDQDCSGADTVICFVDADEDTYGSSIVTTSTTGDCTAVGLSDNDLDCDDNDPNEFPGQIWYEDFDNDTFGNLLAAQVACEQPFGYVLDDTDCDDQLDTISPAEVEVCDGVDNDCMNGIDDGFNDLDNDGIADCVDNDADGDGETNATDCDDTEATVCSACPEICGDNLDNDCDPATTCFDMSYTDGNGTVVTTTIEPYVLNQGFVAWYSYGNPAGSSSNTGFEVADRVVEMLVVDPTNGKTAIVMMSDLPNDPTGGSLVAELSGFTNAAVAFLDDPSENSHTQLDPTTGLGTFTFNWAPCCDDGFVITDMDPLACFTVEMTSSSQVNGLTTYDNATRIDIPGSVNQPLTFCEGY